MMHCAFILCVCGRRRDSRLRPNICGKLGEGGRKEGRGLTKEEVSEAEVVVGSYKEGGREGQIRNSSSLCLHV